MGLISRATGDVIILEIKDSFDDQTAGDVNAWLDSRKLATPSNMVVNLSEVVCIEANGLAVLVKGQKLCRQYRGDLHLCSLQRPVQEVFSETCLDRLFKIFSSEFEAVNTFVLQT